MMSCSACSYFLNYYNLKRIRFLYRQKEVRIPVLIRELLNSSFVHIEYARTYVSMFFFSHLDENERAQVFDAMFPEIHLAGDIIIRQGEKGENFYIIDKGEVNVS